MQSYGTTLTLAGTPSEVFHAINDVRGWWSEDLEGEAHTVGAEFVFHGHDDANTVEHMSHIRVMELVPGERVVWRVLDNKMSFVADQSEWKDTEIRFELSGRGEETELRFSHIGLVPSYECYEACSGGWSYFIGQSLRDFVATGTGNPITKAQASA